MVQQALNKAKFLIIDDDASNVRLLERLLPRLDVRQLRRIQHLRKLRIVLLVEHLRRIRDDRLKHSAQRPDRNMIGQHAGETHHRKNGERRDQLDEKPESHGSEISVGR